MRGATVVGAGGRAEAVPTTLGWAVGGLLGLLVGVPFLYGLHTHVTETTQQGRIAAENVNRKRPF